MITEDLVERILSESASSIRHDACTKDDMCVYGYEAFMPEAYLLGYMSAANCYPNGTTIENVGATALPLFPFGVKFNITCNAFDVDGNPIIIGGKNTGVWCPAGFEWDGFFSQCVMQSVLCDWGYITGGGTTYQCSNPGGDPIKPLLNVTSHPLRCLNDFNPTNNGGISEGPTWNKACCEFVRIGTYTMSKDTKITVY